MNLPPFLGVVDSDAASPKPSDEQGAISGELRDVGLAVHVVDAPGPLGGDVLPADVGSVGRGEPGAARAAGLPRRHQLERREGPLPERRSGAASPAARLRRGPGEVGHLGAQREPLHLPVPVRRRLPGRFPARAPPHSSHLAVNERTGSCRCLVEFAAAIDRS